MALNSSKNFENSLSLEQIEFINNLYIQKNLDIPSNSEFDTKRINTEENYWVYSVGGDKMRLRFDLKNDHLISLLKFTVIQMTQRGSVLYQHELTAYKNLFIEVDLNFESHLNYIENLSKSDNSIEQRAFFYVMKVTILFCRIGLPKFSIENIEKLVFVKRPNVTNPFLKYQDIENAFPSELKTLIASSLVKYSKQIEQLSTLNLFNLLILGLAFTTGMRSSQFSKLASQDLAVDTQSSHTNLTRYSLNISYAKQTRHVTQRYRISLPEEVGIIAACYIQRVGLKDDEQIFKIKDKLSNYLTEKLNEALIFIQPNDTRLLITDKKLIPQRYTLTDFRHNIGHSLAMNGASADQIAFVMGHSSLVAASHYISATPELALIKHKAFGQNPIWQNIIQLMLTGKLISSDTWSGKTVSGLVNGKLLMNIGGCDRPDDACPLAKVRSCYSCFYFRPFRNTEYHLNVYKLIELELFDLIEISEKSGNSKNPLINTSLETLSAIRAVISRIEGLKP